MNRLFIALKIPGEIRKEIINFRNKAWANNSSLKWEPEDKIHLTLKFLGDVEESLTNQIAGLIQFVSDYSSFECRLTRFGFFYKNNEPKILWIGLNINNKIFEIVERLNKELEKFAIPAERKKFNPHITVKRLKGDEGKEFINRFEKFKLPEVEFKASEIALIKSELLPAGSKYTEIKNYKLK